MNNRIVNNHLSWLGVLWRWIPAQYYMRRASLGQAKFWRKVLTWARAFQVGNLNTAISSFSWQRRIKKICARKNGGWREISVRDQCFMKTLFRGLSCCLLAVSCKGNFQKSLNILWNVTCVVASRLLGVSNSQIFKGISRSWVMSRCALRVGGIWLNGEIADRQMKNKIL